MRQGDAGEAGAGAHVRHGLAAEVCQGQQGGTVQKVEGGDMMAIGDGREVHHLVFFQQQVCIPGQGGGALCGQIQGGKARLQQCLHQRCSFKRSRISVSSTSSREGAGGGGGTAVALSFLRWRRLRVLMMQKTTKDMMRKFKTALRWNLPIDHVAAAGQMEDQGREVAVAAGEDAQDGIDDVVDQGVGDGLEGAADDDADGHVHHIAPGDEGLEFSKEAAGFLLVAQGSHLSLGFSALLWKKGRAGTLRGTGVCRARPGWSG